LPGFPIAGGRTWPVLKGTIDGRFAICLVGNKVARSLLRDHSEALKLVTIDVSRLFAGEFMRGMEDDFHKSRRAILIKVLGALNIDVFKPYMQRTIRENLEVYCNAKSSPSRRYDDFYRWSEALSVITSSILFHLVLGAKPGSKQLQDLMSLYRELGPNGVAWNVGDKQVDAYQRIRESLTQNPALEDANGLFAVLSNQGQVDTNVLGNLIYMVETGRYDMRGLFRWISKYAADNPIWFARIWTSEPNQSVIIAKAFVQEVLRLDQSKCLMREMSKDIVLRFFRLQRKPYCGFACGKLIRTTRTSKIHLRFAASGFWANRLLDNDFLLSALISIFARLQISPSIWPQFF
jgi:hypothetical protein